MQETMVEEPTQDLDVSFEAIRKEESEGYEEQGDCDSYDDHGNEKEQPTTILFTPEQFKVLLK
jgi:hypothetical protein